MSDIMSPDTVREMSVYLLADLADCAAPDGHHSPGAGFLDEIRTEVLTAFESDVDEHGLDGVREDRIQDAVSNVAGEAIDYRTHEMWLQFVDLAAYQEGFDEYGTPSTMHDVAVFALCAIGDRLASVLTDALVTWARDQGADDEQ